MNPLSFSSGDLIADRRADYAEMLFASGDRTAACELMRDALVLVPDWAAGHFRLGEMLAEDGREAEAADCWRAVLRLDPADRLGAALKLEIAGFARHAAATSSRFVETLFDQYAADFDAALVERLAYRVPELLAGAIEHTGREGFAHCLDLGCGTGLMGERLRRLVSFLEGFDISSEMLKRAEGKGVYDRLEKADLQSMGSLPEGADIVTAADVFMYVGALDRVFAMAAACLPAGGLFAFSVERHEGEQDLVLGPSRRYAHSQTYVMAVLTAAGFSILSVADAKIRTDRGAPIEGLIVVAERMPAAPPITIISDTVDAERSPLTH